MAARDKAENANRFKSQFLANISHEIRTPLNAVIGLAQLLQHTSLGEGQRDYVGKIVISARALLEILNDVLDISKVEAGKLEIEAAPFSLGGVFDALATLMSMNARDKDLDLIVGVAPDVPNQLIGDALRLRQVLVNLAGNAIKFTKAGEVSVRVDKLAQTEAGVVLRFAVHDSGMGIAPEVLPNLFTAFNQADSSTSRQFGGTGLGLAICKQLVGLMGGEIGAESVVGQGSEFWFTITFPLGKPIAQVRGSDPLDVLIASGHDFACQTLATAAKSLGWLPDCVALGEDALTKVMESVGRNALYDALVVDWKLFGADGLDVCRGIRADKRLDAMPIIAMTTAAERNRLINLPGSDVIDALLTKPVTRSALSAAVADTLARRSGKNSPLAFAVAPVLEKKLAGLRALVVDDNMINQEVAKGILLRLGASVTLAEDGVAALNVLRQMEEAESFHVVLMDIHMPKMDGYEATRHIRNDLKMTELPILALTAGTFAGDRDKALAAGMGDVVGKPIDTDQLVETILRHVSLPRDSMKGDAVVEITAPTLIGLVVGDTPLGAAVPGLNMKLLVERVGDDRELFIMLLRCLVEDYSDFVSKVRADLTGGLSEDAAGRLHTFRGAVGNVAAEKIAIQARTVELAIRRGDEAEAFAELDKLDVTLATLIADVKIRLAD